MRGLVFIDSHGRVWEITPDHPEPRLVTQEMVDSELDLTPDDWQFLAALRIKP